MDCCLITPIGTSVWSTNVRPVACKNLLPTSSGTGPSPMQDIPPPCPRAFSLNQRSKRRRAICVISCRYQQSPMGLGIYNSR
ncbi:hypothetical protein LY78DRAFT_435525 [Colletotrichum sublineola]|nr:hypothetical protein LY78DRAFT_435525 [Colletotrichum sublineola]